MKQRSTELSEIELMETIGGDWEWGDFWSGTTWALGAGCAISGHPALCFGSIMTGGFALYF